eukprot:TRINITY_DN72264_c0_g1_i1.p1 TRINITY_DN72264_c0_g1~~TRINITY_DN72264_c0_g1_i1.p1  ORF type:complete len:445 (-),score=77.41 TRINITY_DN72264_c0_g1_i1:109-1371(-)
MGGGASKKRYVQPVESPTAAKTIAVSPKVEDAPMMRQVSMPTNPTILVADVGGTNSRLALFSVPEGPPGAAASRDDPPIHSHKYVNAYWDNFTDVIIDFLKQAAQPDPPFLGCFAVAGVVVQNTCNLVNLGWTLHGDAIAHEIGMAQVHLLNDFEAQGYGVLTLDVASECDVLQDACTVPGAPIAVIGAGTGLGQAFMTTGANGDYEVWPSEGGHKEFAPRQEGSSDLQTQMMQYLQIKFSAKSRISVERIVSGRGISNIYQFLAWKYPDKLNKEVHKLFCGHLTTTGTGAAAGQVNNPAVVVEAARNGTCSVCMQALDLFVGAYGAEAGVMALKFMPFGGLFVTGGVTNKTRDFILSEKGTPNTFMDAFLDKGRVSPMLTRVPVYLVSGEDMGERGVKLKAMRMISEFNKMRKASKGRG